jgi:hypothetical protein
MKSLLRHTITLWNWHRNNVGDPQETLCAILFNSQGYLHELLKVSMGDVTKGVKCSSPQHVYNDKDACGVEYGGYIP